MNLLFSAVVVALAVANGVVGASADNIRCAQSACSEEMLACFSDYGCSAQIPILGQLADVTNLPPRLAENAALAAVAKCLGTAACVVRRATAEKPSLRVNDGTVVLSGKDVAFSLEECSGAGSICGLAAAVESNLAAIAEADTKAETRDAELKTELVAEINQLKETVTTDLSKRMETVEQAIKDAAAASVQLRSELKETVDGDLKKATQKIDKVTDNIAAVDAAGKKTVKDMAALETSLTKDIAAAVNTAKENAQRFHNSVGGLGAVEYGLVPWFDSCSDAQAAGYRTDAMFYLSKTEKLEARHALCKQMGVDKNGKNLKPTEEKPIKKSCLEWLESGKSISGNYQIDPGNGLGEMTVFCDMTTADGGWTYCYNHNVRNTEEMDHSNLKRFTSNGGTAGKTVDHWRNCHGLHKALKPKTTRIYSGGTAWVEVVKPPRLFDDFWRCGERHTIQVRTNNGFNGYRKANLHDCGSRNNFKSSLNQIGDNTNHNVCFEFNGKGSDSNHHWAIWPSCNGCYVNHGRGQRYRGGWARVMVR